MYKHFVNIGEKFLLSPYFAKCRPYVTRTLFTDEIYPDTDTDDKNSCTLFII